MFRSTRVFRQKAGAYLYQVNSLLRTYRTSGRSDDNQNQIRRKEYHNYGTTKSIHR
jgi:hypothetical protein